MDPFVGQIQIFAFNFPPRNWALCQGQLLAISQNTALFSILGTQFGGNGTSNFALPDLRSRVPIGAGNGPGLSPCVNGEQGGQESVTLLQNQIPPHTHPANCNNSEGNSYDGGGNVWSTDAGGNNEYGSGAIAGQMSQACISSTGGNQPHNNIQPYLALNYCISLFGVFPSRS